MEDEYTTVRVTKETKEALEEARAKETYEISKSLDAFITHLLEQNKKRK